MSHRHVQYAILKNFLCHIIRLHVSKVCGKQFCQYFEFQPFLSYFCPNFCGYFQQLLGTRSTYRCLQYLILKLRLCEFCKVKCQVGVQLTWHELEPDFQKIIRKKTLKIFFMQQLLMQNILKNPSKCSICILVMDFERIFDVAFFFI